MADKPFVPIPVEVNTSEDTFVPIPFDPKTDRNPTSSILYEIADNVIGFDDGFDTFGERITKPIGEAGEGLVSGVIGIGEGIGGLVTLVPDLAIGTEFGNAIDRGGDRLREQLGIDPEGAEGTFAQGIDQFGVPGLAAASADRKDSKLSLIHI